jgi:hypothetical protein
MMRKPIGWMLVLALALGPVPAFAKNKGHGKPENAGQGPGYEEQDAGDVAAGALLGATLAFTSRDRSVISQYFQQYPMGAKPLPPGIARKVARGGSLPPGIAKRYLPQGLLGQLSPLDPRYGRMVVGSDVLMVELATGVILDILRGAAR